MPSAVVAMGDDVMLPAMPKSCEVLPDSDSGAICGLLVSIWGAAAGVRDAEARPGRVL